MRLGLLIACLLLGRVAFGQIFGTIKNDRTEKGIEGVEVFIHGRSSFTVTDAEGKFQLD